MLYMLWRISKELVRTVRMFSSWILPAREIASAFSETVRETDERVRMFSFWMVLAREIASAFPETARETDEMSSEFFSILDLAS